MKINLLIGLPGSGKSTYLKDKVGCILDDMSQIPNALNVLEKAILLKKEDIYIADVNLCNVDIFKKAISKINQMGVNQFNIIYFEADKDTCLNNIKYRNDGRHVIPTVKRFEKGIHDVKNYILEDSRFNLQVIKTPLMQISKQTNKI